MVRRFTRWPVLARPFSLAETSDPSVLNRKPSLLRRMLPPAWWTHLSQTRITPCGHSPPTVATSLRVDHSTQLAACPTPARSPLLWERRNAWRRPSQHDRKRGWPLPWLRTRSDPTPPCTTVCRAESR